MKFTLSVFVLSFCLYLVSTTQLIATVRWPTGDEPYYLLIAHSLIHDGDFELSNNFQAEHYRLYYPGDLYPRHEAVTSKPLLVSKHSLGVSLLIAPAYALAGWRGAAHTMNVLGALLAVNLFLLAREVSGSVRIALIVWLALAFATPFFTYAELIFPEAPAALLIVYAYRQLRQWPQANRPQKFFVGLCLAFLPWLHARFLFIVAPLAIYLLSNVLHSSAQPPSAARRPALLRFVQTHLKPLSFVFWPSFVSAALFFAYNLYVYDSLWPNYADHSGTGHPADIFAAFFGVFLDQQWGLLNHAPVYLLALVALWLQATPRKIFRSEMKWIVFSALPYFLLIVQYRYWWGEWCPPARYLAPILPLLVGPLALALKQYQTTRFNLVLTALTLWGWFVSLLFAVNGKLMYNHPLGRSELLIALSYFLDFDLTRFEPSFIMMFLKDFDPVMWAVKQTALTVGWLVACVVVAWVAFGWAWPTRRVRRASLTPTNKFPIIRATSVPED